MTPEVIQNSFKVCGVSTAVDGSEDDLIHAFKPDGPCPQGRELLEEAMNTDDSSVPPVDEEDRAENAHNAGDVESDLSVEYE